MLAAERPGQAVRLKPVDDLNLLHQAGIIEQIGAPLDMYDNPANQFVAGFVGSPKMNFLQAKVLEMRDGRATVALDGDQNVHLSLPVNAPLQSGARVMLGVRPEHFFDAGKGDADLTVMIEVTEHLGNTSYIYATFAGGEPLIIERPQQREAVYSDTLTVSLSTNRLFLFDSKGQRLR